MSAQNISKNGGPETKVNFNTAPEEELVAVPGVGPAMARRIIAERPFGGVSDLQRVQGILSTNAMNDTRFRSGDSVRDYGIRAALCAPPGSAQSTIHSN